MRMNSGTKNHKTNASLSCIIGKGRFSKFEVIRARRVYEYNRDEMDQGAA